MQCNAAPRRFSAVSAPRADTAIIHKKQTKMKN